MGPIQSNIGQISGCAARSSNVEVSFKTGTLAFTDIDKTIESWINATSSFLGPGRMVWPPRLI